MAELELLQAEYASQAKILEIHAMHTRNKLEGAQACRRGHARVRT
jgi:hypothetical protein